MSTATKSSDVDTEPDAEKPPVVWALETVASFQTLVTSCTLKLPAALTSCTKSFRVAFWMLLAQAPLGSVFRRSNLIRLTTPELTTRDGLLPKPTVPTTYASSVANVSTAVTCGARARATSLSRPRSHGCRVAEHLPPERELHCLRQALRSLFQGEREGRGEGAEACCVPPSP